MKFVRIGFSVIIATVLSILVSCNKNNASAPLPSNMDFLIGTTWRLDTVILNVNSAWDTLTMSDVPGFATSDIRFYNRSDSSFVFKDDTYSYYSGPDDRDSIFHYTYGKWALNAAQDSVYLYSQDTTNSVWYKASWKIARDTANGSFSALYTDTIGGSASTVILQKKVIFAKNSFY